MDLGTIKAKLKAVPAPYATLYAVAEDVRKVWSNCLMYNADGSDFYKLAESLQKKWDDKYTKLLQECSAADPHNNSNTLQGGGADKVSLADKRAFAKALFTIEKEDLGRVLVEVEQKCPAAIVRNSGEDEVELNVDKITGPLLKELMEFVNQVKGGKKKAAVSNKKTKLKA
jgi:Bromodomain/Bromodomain extra-terminal - transcription regulation